MDDHQPDPPHATAHWRARLAGDAVVYVGATVVNAAIPFLLLPFLTRWLDPAQFGIVGLFTAQVSIFQVVVALGTHGMIPVAYFRQGPSAMPPQAGAAIGVIATMSVILFGCVAVLGPWLSTVSGIPELALWLVVGSAAGQCVMAVVLAVLQTLRRPIHYAAVQIGFGIVMACVTIIAVGWLKAGWEGRALGQLIAAGVAACGGLWWLWHLRAVALNSSQWPIRAALSFGVPLLPHSLGAVAIASIDRFTLTKSVGNAALGPYFLAQQMASTLLVLGTALGQAWSPWLFERLASGQPAARLQVVRMAYWAFAFMLAGGAGLALLAPWIIAVVGSKRYVDAGPLLRVLGPAYAFGGMYQFVTGFMFYERRTGILSIITLGIAALLTVLCFFVAAPFGALGVAWAVFLSYMTYFLATWFAANWVHPLPWRSWRTMVGRAATAPDLQSSELQ